MEATAIGIGVVAVVLVFAPEIVLAGLAIEPAGATIPLTQLYGAALFGFAQMFWVARGMSLGGIYGRAVVVGGFGHFFVGAFVLLHALRMAAGNPVIWIGCAVYTALAIAFGTLLFGRGPAAPADAPPR